MIATPNYSANQFMRCFLPLLILLIQSCQSLPTMPSMGGASVKSPDWYINAPANNAFTLYGKGSAGTQQAAVNAALAEVAAALSVTIKSETKTQTTYAGGREDLRLDEQIEASVKAIEFTSFDILRAEQASGRHWVHVKVDKGALAKDINTKVVEQKRALDLEFKDFTRASVLEQSRKAAGIESQLNSLKLNATTLSTLSDYDGSAITTFVTTSLNKLNRIKNNMVMRVEHDTNTGTFARKIEELLAENNIKVVNIGRSAGKSVIAIRGNVEQKRFGNAYVSVVDLKVQAIDDDGKVLHTYVKRLNGASPSNYSAALQQANLKLYNVFVEDEVLNDITGR